MQIHDLDDNFDIDYDIDVDIGPLLGSELPMMVSDEFYRLAQPQEGRSSHLQGKLDKALRNAQWRSQWQAAMRRRMERRRGTRAGLLTRVIVDGGRPMTATDISLRGLRCSGQPTSPLMRIEFKIPGLEFPVDTRAEVMNYRGNPDFPWVGLQFIDMDRPYIGHIARYIDERRRIAA